MVVDLFVDLFVQLKYQMMSVLVILGGIVFVVIFIGRNQILKFTSWLMAILVLVITAILLFIGLIAIR
jgi:hypothetical protein